jgi:hypothetical protein
MKRCFPDQRSQVTAVCPGGGPKRAWRTEGIVARVGKAVPRERTPGRSFERAELIIEIQKEHVKYSVWIPRREPPWLMETVDILAADADTNPTMTS